MSRRGKRASKEGERKNAAQPNINQAETEKLVHKSAQCYSEKDNLLQKFVSEEKYYRRALEIYDECYKVSVYRELIDKIDCDLYRFSITNLPYALYQSYIVAKYLKKHMDKSIAAPRFEHANPDRQIAEIIDDNASEHNRMPTALVLMPFIYAHLENLLRQSELINCKQSSNDLLNFRKLRLLTSVLSGKIAFVVESLINELDSENLTYLDDDLDKLSDRALVDRFFFALRKREKSVCFKILGRARNLEQGESDYLEAIARFYDHDYDNAIRLAMRVREGCYRYSSAVSLLLECYARQGNLVKLVDCVSNNKTLKYQYLQLEYLRQETILNSHCSRIEWFDARVKALNQLADYINQRVAPGISGDTYYFKLVKNSVECIVKIYENYYDAFYHVSNSILKVATDIENYMALLSISGLSGFYAIKGLLSKINLDVTTISDDWLQNFRRTALYIIEQITGLNSKIPVINMRNHPLDLWMLGLESIYNLGLFARFTDKIDRNLDVLVVLYKQVKDERIADLILRAYVEESIRGNLNEKIKTFVATQLKDRAGDLSLEQKMVARRLSKNGQIALESAEALFQLSKEIDWGWKDAGMISLGYLRIIEVEINQRLILPVVDILGFGQMECEYESVRKLLAGEKAKWGGIISSLGKVMNNQGDLTGLMLSDLHHFFINIGSGITAGDRLAQDIRNSISKLLSDGANIDAFISVIEKDVVSENIRKKYRNPPAHGEYVTYQTACECREYFYQVMQKLQNALKSSSAEHVQLG